MLTWSGCQTTNNMRRPKAFITGILGFAGSHLAEELLAAGYDVIGNRYKREPIHNVRHIRKQIELVSLDILNTERCRKVIHEVRPDYLFHLAAIASVGKSFSMEQITYRINLEGTLNVLRAANDIGGLRKLVFVSSSDCYGKFKPSNMTLTEKQPLSPISPYAIAKAAAEHASRYYYRQHGLPVVVARAFNHAGPRQADGFVVAAFARQIALIEIGKQKPVMKVGDLSARRDFSDVRDIVSGYRLTAEKGNQGEVYQLCSGKTVTIQRILDTLLSLTDKKIIVKTDRSRLRQAEIPVLRGSNKKAAKDLGYTPAYGLKFTLADTLDYWREKVRMG